MTEAPAHHAPAGDVAHAMGAVILSLVLFAGGLMWLRFGEAIYVERLLAALAGCF